MKVNLMSGCAKGQTNIEFGLEIKDPSKKHI
jgi:hypothetical protein